MELKGSIEVTEVKDRRVYTMQGLSADASNLPKDGIGAGSTCQMLDTGDIYQYHEKSKTWYKL